MFSWLIFGGIIATFIISYFFLYHYKGHSWFDLHKFFTLSDKNKRKEDWYKKYRSLNIEKKQEEQQVKKYNKGGLYMTDGTKELIKTPVVIGENVIQKMEESNLSLDFTAIKVKDVIPTITNVVSEVAIDKVILQGIIHKQIFYVGTDNIIHHQSADEKFTYFVNIPGAEPDMDVIVEPSVEHVLSQLLLDGNILQQKIVLQFFVKVLSQQQLFVETGTGPLIKVERVVGENCQQRMVNAEVTLAVEARKVVDVIAQVVNIQTDVIKDKVIIEGIIHKQLFYIGIDEVEHHQVEDIPFSQFIDIPGAEDGMNVKVQSDVLYIEPELNEDGITINQEIVLELFVKVTEFAQINIVAGNDALVMLPEVIGENTKQFLSEQKVKLEKKSLKIKEIELTFTNLDEVVIKDKVIVQGLILEQIFYIGEDDIEYHQTEEITFSVFVPIIGARPNMNVNVIPEVSYIKPELNMAGDHISQKIIGEIFVKVTENIQFNVKEIEQA